MNVRDSIQKIQSKLYSKTYISDKGEEYTDEKLCSVHLEYFLNCRLPKKTCKYKAICTNNYTLRTVKDVIDYFSIKENLENTVRETPSNLWQYFGNIIFEFRKETKQHHAISEEKRGEYFIKEYFSSLEEMSDKEISEYLWNNPVEFDPHTIRHGSHRAYAMIGRLIKGKKYIPFRMPVKNYYCPDPKSKYYEIDNKCDYDHLHSYSPIFKVKYLNELDKINLSDYTICQSGILALMEIKENDDLDIIISSKLRKESFQDQKGFLPLGNGTIQIFPEDTGKFLKFGAWNDDDLIRNYSIEIEGVNFLEPRFYFSRKKWDDRVILNKVITFFKQEKHLYMYPYNLISPELWGVEYIPNPS